MTTVIQQPKNDDSSAAGFIIGIAVAAIVAVLFVVYAWPTMSNNSTAANPAPASPNVNVTVKEKNESTHLDAAPPSTTPAPEPDNAQPSSSPNP